MEFNEKLQDLRKKKGLTQEELARELYVSRTAVSKWESGRGYPSIASLTQIAKFFSVTVDELLSSGEALSLAEEETKQRANSLRGLVFALLDLSALMLLFLPIFGQSQGDEIVSVSLLQLTKTSLWLRILYYIVIAATVVVGVLSLALELFNYAPREKRKNTVSLAINVGGVFVFTLSSQVYAALLWFTFLIIKTLFVLKSK